MNIVKTATVRFAHGEKVADLLAVLAQVPPTAQVTFKSHEADPRDQRDSGYTDIKFAWTGPDHG